MVGVEGGGGGGEDDEERKEVKWVRRHHTPPPSAHACKRACLRSLTQKRRKRRLGSAGFDPEMLRFVPTKFAHGKHLPADKV